MSKANDWIQTFSGKAFHPADPKPESIDLKDIAHALSLTCRFSGHLREFYSVAQHSVYVMEMVSERCKQENEPGASRTKFEYAALMHDASEAYLTDIPRPIKRMPELAGYRALEERVEAAIRQRFGIDPFRAAHPWIKDADLRVLAAETRDLLATPDKKWELRADPMRRKVEPMGPREAEALFLFEHDRLVEIMRREALR